MAAGTDVSDADINILEHQLKHLEEPEELPCYRTLRINTEDAIHNIVNALKRIPVEPIYPFEPTISGRMDRGVRVTAVSCIIAAHQGPASRLPQNIKDVE